MRSFSNIMPNFAGNLHLLVDSIVPKQFEIFLKIPAKSLEGSQFLFIFASDSVKYCFFNETKEV